MSGERVAHAGGARKWGQSLVPIKEQVGSIKLME